MQSHLDFKKNSLGKHSAKTRVLFATVALAAVSFIIFLIVRSNSSVNSNDHQPAGKHGTKQGDGMPVPVTVASATNAVLPLEIRNIGNVEAFSVVNVIAQVGGQLTNVYFTQGQYVKKGDLLFKIDPRPYEAQLAQAEANVARDKSQISSAQANLEKDMAGARQAQANLNKDIASQNYADVEVRRYIALVEQGAVSHEQSDQMKTNAETAGATVASDKAALENAQAVIDSDKAAVLTARANLKADQAAADNLQIQLGFTKIFSPVNGVTGALNVYQGNVVRANDTTPLVTINQIQPIYVTFSVPEVHLPAVRESISEGSIKVSARVGGNKKDTVTGGTLAFINNTVDTTTGTIRLRATFPNVNKVLWPGEFTDVIVTLPGAKPQIVVPTSAILNDQQGQSVFVVKPDNTVDLAQVQVDRTYGDESILSEGLKEGDVVVVDGQLKLLPGSSITITQASPADKPQSSPPVSGPPIL
jgi:membrane fusion protein, multidrug efflux system